MSLLQMSYLDSFQMSQTDGANRWDPVRKMHVKHSKEDRTDR